MKHKKAIATISTILAGGAILAICAVVKPDEKSGNAVDKLQTAETQCTEVSTEVVEEVEEVSATVEEVTGEIVKKADKKKYTGPFAGKFVVNINGDYLNVRAQAKADAEIIGKLYVGSGGKVLKKGKKWTRISSGSVKGYVSTEYLVFDKAAEKKAKEVGTTVVTINADSLRVRKQPGTDAGVYGTVAKGEKFVGMGNEKNGWVAINYEGKEGYVSAEYVSSELTIGKAVSIEEEQAAIRAEQERIAAEKAEEERREKERAEALAQAVANSKLVETVQGSGYNVTEEEAYLIACVVSTEAGYECYEGQLAVANIILNRLASGRFGTTVKDVLYARGQFTVVNTDRFARVMAQGPNATSLAATKAALSGTNNIPGFTSYCASWAANYGRYTEYTIVGNQTFYR